jgi:hypothetical protein
MLASLHRRLTKLEARQRPAQPKGRMISFEEMDPAMVAMYVALDCDVGRMSLDQLNLWEAEIMRFAD